MSWLLLVFAIIPMACEAQGSSIMLDLHHQLLLAHSTLACAKVKPRHSPGPSPKPTDAPLTGLLSYILTGPFQPLCSSLSP